MNASVNVVFLLTCHNRRDKTLACLERIFAQHYLPHVDARVVLVDDGSTDGTSAAVKTHYPSVHVVRGTGSLFWAGGMSLAMRKAREYGNATYYILLNDDTLLFEHALGDLLAGDAYAQSAYGSSGLLVGSTLDPESETFSYGGHALLKPHSYAVRDLPPNGRYQEAHFCNANILLLPAVVLERMGFFDPYYIHSIADFDYSYRVHKAGLPVLVLPNYLGTCTDDHRAPGTRHLKSFRKRLNYLYSSKGFAYREFMHFVRTHFPRKAFTTGMSLWFRALLPELWDLWKRPVKSNREAA
ncbi:MAG: glycosyltransferase family 2 protein [Bacteroidales bacterium]|nr:glycosyltransferase family 2 protein [Bacteroidales bacterium]MDD4770579.1 glycosyltransferase family 2 protein [Bacteroidales bacterium]